MAGPQQHTPRLHGTLHTPLCHIIIVRVVHVGPWYYPRVCQRVVSVQAEVHIPSILYLALPPPQLPDLSMPGLSTPHRPIHTGIHTIMAGETHKKPKLHSSLIAICYENSQTCKT